MQLCQVVQHAVASAGFGSRILGERGAVGVYPTYNMLNGPMIVLDGKALLVFAAQAAPATLKQFFQIDPNRFRLYSIPEQHFSHQFRMVAFLARSVPGVSREYSQALWIQGMGSATRRAALYPAPSGAENPAAV